MSGGERVLAGTARSRVGEAEAEAALYPVELQEKVDAYLEGLSFAVEPGVERLEEAMRYSLLAGGKRIRPVLALATAEALDRPPDEVLPLAAALEMVHTYSLIHDDLPPMDDDELRRGKPTCHVAFGEDVAILAGDGLFAEALRLALAEQQGEPANVLAAVREIVGAAHDCAGGHRRADQRAGLACMHRLQAVSIEWRRRVMRPGPTAHAGTPRRRARRRPGSPRPRRSGHGTSAGPGAARRRPSPAGRRGSVSRCG